MIVQPSLQSASQQSDYTLDELAQLLHGHVHGDGSCVIQGIKSLQAADRATIAYVKDDSYLAQAQQSLAACLVIPNTLLEHFADRNVITVASPYAAFATLSQLFDPEAKYQAFIHPQAQIAASAQIGSNVYIGYGVVIAENVTIGDHCVILAHSVIGEGVRMGSHCYIDAHVVITGRATLGDEVRIHANTTIGSEGFGFAPNQQGEWQRIVQLGSVVIGNRVRIGANCSIDRGALDNTILEDGVIIDNLVQIAHNVQIGAHTAIAAKCGIAGSTRIGQHCILGGACGVSGHLSITDHVHFTGMSMVTKSIHRAGTYSSGTSILDNQSWKKAVVGFRQLAQTPLQSIIKSLQKIEHRLEQLEQPSAHPQNPQYLPDKQS